MKDIIKKLVHARLHEIERLKGGVADGKTIEDLADKHDVSLSQIKQELARGIKHEMEHTNSRNIAKEIAMDHLFKDPKYYTKLKRLKLDENETPIVGDVPSLKYNVKIKGRPAGTVTIGPSLPELGDDTAEIIGIQMAEGYNELPYIIQAVNHIWNALPEVQRIVVTVNAENMWLWETLGFQRLNNSYWFTMRGH